MNSILRNVLCSLVLSVVAPVVASAQTPSFTLTYDQILPFVEPQVSAMLEKDGRLSWGADPHIQIGPQDVGGFNNRVNIHLNLEGSKSILGIDVSTSVFVDVVISASCESGSVTSSIFDVTWDTSLPGWVQDLFVGDVSISRSSLDGFLTMANSLLSSVAQCGDVRAWPEGIVLFPGDHWDPFTGDATLSTCSDGTSGRVGQVHIENGQIIAEILPGSTPRWPDVAPWLELWVSTDGTEGSSRMYPYGPTEKTLSEGFYGDGGPVGGGATQAYNLPDGYFFAGCEIDW